MGEDRQAHWLLEARGLVKDYPGVRALDGVDLRIRPGEAIGLCGENGAGKSTLLKILSGHIPHGHYAGKLHWQGQPLQLKGPASAMHEGIRIIHQELALAPHLTVAENLFLGAEKLKGPKSLGGFRPIDVSAQARAARERLETLGLGHIDPRRRVGDLPVGLMQGVEIARALLGGGRLLILDEPTSALSHKETDTLLDLVLSLKAQGVALIYVSHKLPEVFRIADRLVILRNGKSAGLFEQKPFEGRQVATAMVGRSLNEVFPPLPAVPAEAPRLLATRHFAVTDARTGRCLVHDLNLEVRAGEIVGLAGLLGAGRTETLEALFGLPRWQARGEVSAPKSAAWRTPFANPAAAKLQGMALLPEDRRRHGLHTAMGLRWNHSLAALDRFTGPMGFMRQATEAHAAKASIERLRIKAAHGEVAVATLSGGNQQKVVLAKWLETEPRLLLLDDPTRGVDVGAKAEIYRLMIEWAASGLGILLASSENEEVLRLCHRIYVLREGRCIGEYAQGALNQEQLVTLCAA